MSKGSNKSYLLQKLSKKYGEVKKVGKSLSLFMISSIDTIVYFRYSKITSVSANVTKAFYGLRKEDLDVMKGKQSFICLLTDDEDKNLLLPFRQFESYFSYIKPSKDDQFKTMVFFNPQGTDLYFANIGRFKADSYLGLEKLFNVVQSQLPVPQLSHSQLQSLIGSIGIEKGFDIWFPKNDILKIDKTIINLSKVKNELPNYPKNVESIISQIDVIWFENTRPMAFYEIEYSTPIYSGLLRFNDVLLTVSGADNFNIIASSEKENKFIKQITRPTFNQNKLINLVNFLNYSNVYHWYYNLTGKLYE